MKYNVNAIDRKNLHEMDNYCAAGRQFVNSRVQFTNINYLASTLSTLQDVLNWSRT